jgi:two-component system, chemotaxis family, sensor kinase CheA
VNTDKLYKLLNETSMAILNYEDGDMMLASEMIDKMRTVKSELASFKFSLSIASSIINILHRKIRDGILINFSEMMTTGLDLLSKLLKIITESGEEQIDEYLKNEIEGFIKNINELNTEDDNKTSGHKASNSESSKDNPNLIINSEPFKIFLVEADERILEAQDLILNLENDMKNKDIINKLFRIFHTIKGECGFLRLASMGELTHSLENLLDMVRNDEIENNPEIIEILFKGIDKAREILLLLKDGDITVFNRIVLEDMNSSIAEQTHKVKKNIGEILLDEGKLSETEVMQILQKQKEMNFTKKFCEIAKDDNLITEEDINETLDKQKKVPGVLHEKTDTIIKVKSSQINFLVDMIGELLIAENQLDDKEKSVIQLKKISKEIQIAAMQLRTIKVKNLFINMKRLIRDLSKKLDKNIEVELIGEELEIDRNLVEMLEEPLVHLLRNSVWHGIENESERVLMKKEPAGRITISAERKGNNVVISVRDDGKGLNEDKILSKAMEKSLVTKERAKTLTKSEILDFIFLPGFSTAEAVDKVSGRGVGMDIVKTVVGTSRGKIEIQSEKNEFTEISLIFPLSMAIIDGMIVKTEDTHFIIPVSNIIESIQVEKNMIYKVQNEDNVINLRQKIIPIVSLREFFNMDEVLKKDVILAVIVESRGKNFAFIVNDIIAKKEIVIKPLNAKFKNLKGISSGTILPGGMIGFILDIDQIIETSSA